LMLNEHANEVILNVFDEALNKTVERFQIYFTPPVKEGLVSGKEIVLPFIPKIVNPSKSIDLRQTKLTIEGNVENADYVILDYGKEVIVWVKSNNFKKEIELPQGMSWIRAKGCNSDNCSNWSKSVPVFVDSIAPETPTLTLETPDKKIIVWATGERFSTVEFYDGQNIACSKTITRNDNRISCLITENRDGRLWGFKACSHDRIGNWSGSSAVTLYQDVPEVVEIPIANPAPSIPDDPVKIPPTEENSGEVESETVQEGELYVEYNVYEDGRVEIEKYELLAPSIFDVIKDNNELRLRGVVAVKGTARIKFFEKKNKFLGLIGGDDVLVDTKVIQFAPQNKWLKVNGSSFRIDSSDGGFDVKVSKNQIDGYAKYNVYGYYLVSNWGKNFELHYNLTSDGTYFDGKSEPDFYQNPSNDPLCSGRHNSNKQYSVSEAALLLSEMLATGTNGWYSKFKCNDPYCEYIPKKVRDVYNLAGNVWNPTGNPNSYVQCIAFVYMAYNMADNPIRKVSGNAITFAGKNWKCYGKDWKGDCVDWRLINDSVYSDQFEVFESGESSEVPRVGDLMVWDNAPYGHVGVVTNVKSNLLELANSNSDGPIKQYKIQLENGTYVIVTKDRKYSGWIPRWWSRKK